jgi:hypothetical protein
MTAMFDPANVVILFADLQPALVANSVTNPPKLVEAGAGALARAGTILDIPILFSVVPEDGGPPTHLPALAGHATPANSFTRHCASPFGDAAFVTALEATGRRTLVIAGYSTEAVIVFATLEAIERGFKVVVALDAGGARSARTENAILRRIERAGAIVTSVADIVMTAAPDFSTSPGRETLAAIHELMAAKP